MSNHLKILIAGGYGTFGGRLVELLENEARLTLVVAGRSSEKAKTWCQSRTAATATLIPAYFDRTGDLAAQLVELRPDIVVDASGPFQDYGADGYRLVEACIAAKIHYLDLADGSDFVKGIAAFDEPARKAGVLVLSGVSSFPALTAAVVQLLSRDMAKVNSIRGGIAPSPYAGVGKNVIRAIAGYAGQEMTLTQAGRSKKAWPLTECMRYTISPPGRLPLKNTLFSLVDVPDLKVLADLWPETETIWMGAGPVPEILHRALIGFAWLVRLKIMKTILPLSGLMDFVTNHVRWGEHRGGMFVEIAGQDAKGETVRKSWHLLAEGRDGPLIPSMTVESLVRKILEGDKITPGARTALQDITLDDYDRLFRRRTIYTGFRQDVPQHGMPLYMHILGNVWESLPAPIRDMHDFKQAASAQGSAVIERGKNPVARLVAYLIGFPAAGQDVPVTVRFTAQDGVEKWTRIFNGREFFSLQYEGKGRDQRLLMEQFGPMTFSMALVWDGEALRLVLRGWKMFGIPIPMVLCPRSDSYETVRDGKFNFNVEISHPLIGRIVHYNGWLEKQ